MRNATSTSPAYEGYDLPPAKRQRVAAGGQAVAVEENSEEGYFDIPAFLRRQAD
jgi:cell division protein FtsZ